LDLPQKGNDDTHCLIKPPIELVFGHIGPLENPSPP